MPRYQIHANCQLPAYIDNDISIVVVCDAPSDAEAEQMARAVSAFGIDVTDIRCDTCGQVVEDCICEEESE